MATDGVSVLLDTDVLIECLRGIPAAQTWLASLDMTQFSIPGVVAMELIMGCTTQIRLQQTQQFLQAFRIQWADKNDTALAYQLLVRHRLTGGLSIPDCLIAAQALNLSTLLYSFNIRHFSKVAGLNVQQLYLRP
jgi:predicted nucleic acid-binding protein